MVTVGFNGFEWPDDEPNRKWRKRLIIGIVVLILGWLIL